MDWSASLSLTTSRAKQHRANYGSFASSSVSTIHIPQSIPEHQCVEKFTSPRVRPIEIYGVDEGTGLQTAYGARTTTMTMTEKPTDPRAPTFKMLLTSAASRLNAGNRKTNNDQSQFRIDEQFLKQHGTHGGAAARAAGDDQSQVTSSYWIQERERIRMKRDRRHGSPTKPSSSTREGTTTRLGGWKTTAVMCSVPLVILVVFLILVLVYGDSLDGSTISTAAHKLLHLPTTSAASSRSGHGHLRRVLTSSV